MRNKRIPSCALVIGLLLVGCSAQGTKSLSAESKMPELRPVIVRGAMDLEVKKFASRLDNVSVERVGSWTFWRGTLDGYPVIVSKTLKGVSNSAAATAIAAERYHPVAIVNQGTAGGHDQQLQHTIISVLHISNSGGTKRRPPSFKEQSNRPGEKAIIWATWGTATQLRGGVLRRLRY